MIHDERVRSLNERDENREIGKFVLYWAQQSIRSQFNHALEFAIDRANAIQCPLLVCASMVDSFPEANERHYAFLLQGYRDLSKNLDKRSICFKVLHGEPDDVIVRAARDAVLVVTDMGYLRIQKLWRSKVAEKLTMRFIQVESDVCVPVETASFRSEFSARTIRPKLHNLWPKFLVPLAERNLIDISDVSHLIADIETVDVLNFDSILASLPINHEVKPSAVYQGGEDAAQLALTDFVDGNALKYYSTQHNEPSGLHTSNMSIYFHYGQISPLQVVLEVLKKNNVPKDSRDTYIEEVAVRRELSFNFCHYNPDKYDTIQAIPDWAKKSLNEHAQDKREKIYTLQELEFGQTHDIFWNAAQMDMVIRGKMPNYMRMYWGKMFVYWSETYKEAYERLAHLNNKYEIDGRDCVSWTNFVWIFGQHDRPFAMRPILGSLRPLSSEGLLRKFDISKYVSQVSQSDKKCIGKYLETNQTTLKGRKRSL